MEGDILYQLSTEAEDSWEIVKIIFPYTHMKAPQKKIIQSILSSPQPMLISSQIGVGKTAALLTSLLALKKPDEKLIIFVRTKAVIGRKVQNCHPQKSAHIVNNILEAFKNSGLIFQFSSVSTKAVSLDL